MKDLIKFIVSSIVDNPNQVGIEESKDSQTGLTYLNLSLDNNDIGKVIGKKGRIIRAIRNLLKVRAILKGEKVVFNIKE